MKAIETTYNGYRFRSRLEARWAVFFDELGISWEYEPEGFEFPNGVRYLPDFKVGNRWVEIKPEAPSWEEEFKMCCLVSSTKLSGMILSGSPGRQRMFFFEADGSPLMEEARPQATREYIAALVGLMLSEKSFELGNVQAAINKSRSARFYE